MVRLCSGDVGGWVRSKGSFRVGSCTRGSGFLHIGFEDPDEDCELWCDNIGDCCVSRLEAKVALVVRESGERIRSLAEACEGLIGSESDPTEDRCNLAVTFVVSWDGLCVDG